MHDLSSFLNTITVLGGAGTIIATQILKSKLVPVPFQKWPVPTTIGISAISTYLCLLWQDYTFDWSNWQQAAASFIVVLGVACIIYNNSIHNWPAAKNLEASKY